MAFEQQAAFLAALGHTPVLYVHPADADQHAGHVELDVRTDDRIEQGEAYLFGEDDDLSAEEQLEEELEQLEFERQADQQEDDQ